MLIGFSQRRQINNIFSKFSSLFTINLLKLILHPIYSSLTCRTTYSNTWAHQTDCWPASLHPYVLRAFSVSPGQQCIYWSWHSHGHWTLYSQNVIILVSHRLCFQYCALFWCTCIMYERASVKFQMLSRWPGVLMDTELLILRKMQFVWHRVSLLRTLLLRCMCCKCERASVECRLPHIIQWFLIFFLPLYHLYSACVPVNSSRWKECMSTVWPEGCWWPKSVGDGYAGDRG